MCRLRSCVQPRVSICVAAERPLQWLLPRSLFPGKAQMGERSFNLDAVQRELDKLQRSPPTSKETEVASRSLVRFARASKDSDEEHAIRATEEWVRLYVALRRAGGPEVERLTAETLRTWHARVTRQFLGSGSVLGPQG